MIIVSKLLWKLAGVSPEWGNRVMDILGVERYTAVSILQHEKI